MISIIIPIYNTPFNRFKKCITSILDNNFSDLEIIVVDDGSDKEYSTLYQEYCIKIGYIKYFRILNRGPSAARNYGILKSNGDYISFVDADDYVAPFFLYDVKKIIDNFKQPDMIIGLVKYTNNDHLYFSNNNSIQIYQSIDYEEKALLINHMLGNLDERYCFGELGHISDGPVARLVKRSVILNNGFDETLLWNEDTIWNIKVLSKCDNIVVLNRTWYAYYNYLNSSTNKFRVNCLEEFLRILPIEFETMKLTWSNNYSGIYYMIYKDLRILIRTYIFHKDNHINLCKRFYIFKFAVDNPLIQDALKHIAKKHKITSFKEVTKHIFYLDMLYGTKLLSFLLFFYRYNIKI